MLKKQKEKCHSEYKVCDILAKDGVGIVDVDNVQTPILTSLTKLRSGYPTGKSWAKRVVNTTNSAFFNSATIILQHKGEGCRRHIHPDCDEFWVILDGKMKIDVGDERKEFIASAGDIIYLKKGIAHKLTVISDEPGIRLSVSVENMQNIYDDEEL